MLEKAMKAAKKYLEIKEYEILDYYEDIICAKDVNNNDIVIVKVSVSNDPIYDIADNMMSRSDFEHKIMWILETFEDATNMGCRYDSIVMSVIGNNKDKAILRHHIDVELED